MSFPSGPYGEGTMRFGLLFFSSSESILDEQKYRLLIESAKYADAHDFSSVWLPERHFTKEGGLYPNPAVLQAALARETSRIQLRAGSVVMPLHNPIRVAEEWSVVDNLSGGRVGLSFASGWHPNDFVFFPERYENRHDEMYRGIEVVQRLWRGETVRQAGVGGQETEIRIYPTPLQKELPIWVTASGSPQTFKRAGEIGAHMLTNLLNQSFEELAERISLYREALFASGHDPSSRQVTVAMPTFIGEDLEVIGGEVLRAFTNYIKSASHLLKAVAYSRQQEVNFDSLSGQELDDYVQWVADRLTTQRRVLLGTPDACFKQIAELRAIGVDEIAYQVDFGIDTDLALRNLPYLNQLKDLCASENFSRQVRLLGPRAETKSAVSASVARPAQPGVAVASLSEHGEESLEEILSRCSEEIAGPALFERLGQQDAHFDSGFQGIERLRRRDGEAIASVRLLAELEWEADAYHIHPSLLGTCFQIMLAALPANGHSPGNGAPYLAAGLRRLQIHNRPQEQVWSHARLTSGAQTKSLEGDVRLLDAHGSVLLEVLGLKMQPLDQAQWAQSEQADQSSNLEDTENTGAPLTGVFRNEPKQAGVWRERLQSVSTEERESLLESYLCEQLGRVLELPPEKIDVLEAINNFGLDSLMAVQLKNRIEGDLEVVIPVSTFLRGASVKQLSTQLQSQLETHIPVAPSLTANAGDLTEHPLSIGQQALWFMHQLLPEGASYNTLEIAATIRGHLDPEALRRAFQALIDRHRSLRTVYSLSDEKPVARILERQEIHFEIKDASPWSDAELNERMAEEYRRPFDLSRGPLLRVTLFTKTPVEHVLLLTTHHIGIDFLSLEIIMNELQLLYVAEKTGIPAALPSPSIQYTDYVRWQAEMLAGADGDRLASYWQRHLAGELPVLNLPTDRPRPLHQTLRGDVHSCKLDGELTSQLKTLAKNEGVTLYTVLLAVFYTLLYRYTLEGDLLVNSPMASRSRTEFEGVVGYFANPVVLRANLSGDQSFRALLAQVNQTVFGALDHQDYPFSLLVEQLQPNRSPNRTPLSDVVFNMDRPLKGGVIGAMMDQPSSGELAMDPFVIEQRVARYDLVLLVLEGEAQLSALWQYKTELFNAATVARMAEHYESLLGSVVAQPAAQLDRLAMLNAEQKEQQVLVAGVARESKNRKLRSNRRRAVNLSQVDLVKTEFLRPGQTLPLVIRPNVGQVDLQDWARSNQQFIESGLLEQGAVLFRDFPVHTAADFESFAKVFCPELFGEYGDLPREEVSDKVYTSTPYPQDQMILLHNESSQMHCWPRKIWFYCDTPATAGGETPIVDCREIYRLLDPEIRERFQQKDLMYVRNFREGLDVSWQEFFRTDQRTKVEEYCRRVGIEFEWRPDNGLRTRKHAPAVARHTKTGEMVFFNQLQAHHISCIEPATRRSLLSLFSMADLPRNVYYGDGTPIEDEVVAEIRQVYERATITFPWQHGDILMLDNMLSAHGRNPYTGTRKILVTMGDMIFAEDLRGVEAVPA